jgi:superfamily II DNA or RNA helicase/HKD family nuclease
MSKLVRGLYESIITPALHAEIDRLGKDLEFRDEAPRSADIADRLARHLEGVLRRAFDSLPEDDRVPAAVAVCRGLLGHLNELMPDQQLLDDAPSDPTKVLRAILARNPDGQAEVLTEPLIPLLDTTLLTNSRGEPRVGSQILQEFASSDEVNVIMAFIRRSGINPQINQIRSLTAKGKRVRFITTTFTGTTEAEALDLLKSVGAEVKVSYDRSTSRLHAKAWHFHRDTGYSTAYIGSSNLTHAGQERGLEWNVRLSEAKNPDVLSKFRAVFDSYWNSPDFIDYDAEDFRLRSQTEPIQSASTLSPLEIRLEPFQERLLEQILASRQLGHHRNLLVSATGTGKTVMAAMDYRRLQLSLPRSRLLFVAHREEILAQSMATFRQALREPSFGELWVGGHRPKSFDHVFASIQSLSASGLDALAPDHFDVVVVDEFHHAAARTYENLLTHVEPVELLGLTATPERSDGLPVLSHFGGRIAAELRLWDAIDQQRLVPFEYFGIHDGLDLRDIPWRRGRGYDQAALSNLVTGNDIWARTVVQQLIRRADTSQLKGLAFCVSVEHARFMARIFNAASIPSEAIWADTPEEERKAALRRLARGETRIVCSVDLFNEGVDVPVVNTLLMLRPSDSPVLFLQQLGRGLRRSPEKSACLVLDFVGQHRKEYRFDRRYRALLGGGRAELRRQVELGFPFLPAGCHMELDTVASSIVLENLWSSPLSRWSEKSAELARLNQELGRPAALREFLETSELELDDIYDGSRGWSDLLEASGLQLFGNGPSETPLRRACGRLLHIDDLVRIRTYRRLLSAEAPPELRSLTEKDRRLLRMLVASVAETVLKRQDSLENAASLIWQHPNVRRELLELFDVLEARIDHAHAPLQVRPNVPLQIHARYTRVEILAAFGQGDSASVAKWQTGVFWNERESSDLLAFTLDKTTGSFSPTTRYRDYAISRDHIHWESQSVTRADSETGRRYQGHANTGSAVMLFARPDTSERAFWFLGPVTYVAHKGEKPMAITWRLHSPLPGDLFASMAVAIA